MDQEEVNESVLQLIYLIVNKKINVWPYPHIVFSPGEIKFSRKMFHHLPFDKSYVKLNTLGRIPPGIYEERRVMTNEMLKVLHGELGSFWSSALGVLHHPVLKQVIFDKFGVTSSVSDTDSLLVRDSVGYSIGPHTDSPARIISCLFYLGEGGKDWGTSIYVPKDPEFRCKGGPHHKRENFYNIATAPFSIGAGIIFLKTDNSFHGVEKVQSPRDRNLVNRDLFLLDYRHPKQ